VKFEVGTAVTVKVTLTGCGFKRNLEKKLLHGNKTMTNIHEST